MSQTSTFLPSIINLFLPKHKTNNLTYVIHQTAATCTVILLDTLDSDLLTHDLSMEQFEQLKFYEYLSSQKYTFNSKRQWLLEQCKSTIYF